jgi:hypothetical protein
LALIEEKTHLLVEKVASRAIVSIIYVILLALLIPFPAYYIYFNVYIPYHDRARHHYTLRTAEDYEKLSDEELIHILNGEDPVLCRYEAENVLLIRNSISALPKPSNYYYEFTDKKINAELSKMSDIEIETILSRIPNEEKKTLLRCMQWKVGGW